MGHLHQWVIQSRKHENFGTARLNNGFFIGARQTSGFYGGIHRGAREGLSVIVLAATVGKRLYPAMDIVSLNRGTRIRSGLEVLD